MESFGLKIVQVVSTRPLVLPLADFTDLAHISKEFLTTPPIKSPIIEVLLRAAYAECAITARAPTEVLASAQFDLAILDTSTLFANYIPVGFFIE